MIALKNIHKAFGKNAVLKGVDLEIGDGKAIALLGPNGSGKSTIMKTVLGLVVPDAGQITVNGTNALKSAIYRKDIGYMPQIFRFPENLRVKELIRLMKEIRNQEGDDQRLVRLFEMEPFIEKRIAELSGGTRQKANAIIALMFDTPILVMDEPTAGLDPYFRLKFKDEVKSRKAQGRTILLTTHLLNEVEDLADEIIYLLDGRIFFRGTVQGLLTEQQATTFEEAIAKLSRGKTVASPVERKPVAPFKLHVA